MIGWPQYSVPSICHVHDLREPSADAICKRFVTLGDVDLDRVGALSDTVDTAIAGERFEHAINGWPLRAELRRRIPTLDGWTRDRRRVAGCGRVAQVVGSLRTTGTSGRARTGEKRHHYAHRDVPCQEHIVTSADTVHITSRCG